MQPDIARLLRENNLRYGDKFQLITEDESLRPIYFIAPEINRQQIRIDNSGFKEFCRNIRGFTHEMKSYYEARIIESKELKGHPLTGRFSLLGGSQLMVEYGEIRLLQLVPYEPGDIMVSADGKLLMTGDCVTLQTEEGSFAYFEESLFTRETDSSESIWIVGYKHSSLEIELEHMLTGKKLPLYRDNDIWTIRQTQPETLARHRSDYSQDNNPIRRQPRFKLVKQKAEKWYLLENEFKYVRYRLRKILKCMLMGSSTSSVFTWLAQLKELNGRVRGFTQPFLPESDLNEKVVDKRVQQLCRRYEVFYHLIEIIKIMFRERTLKAWSEVFVDIITTLRVISMSNPDNCRELYPLLDYLLRQETDRQVNQQIQELVSGHQQLLIYFSRFRELGQKGNDMIMPLECLVNRLSIQEDFADRISCLRLIEEICSSQGHSVFLNQEGVFRAIRQENFKRSRTLLSIQTSDKIYVESFQEKAALEDLFSKYDTKQIKDLLELLQQQLVLVASLTSHCHREAVNAYLEQYRPFQQYFTSSILNNQSSAAVSRLILGIQTKFKRDYGGYQVRILEDRAENVGSKITPPAINQINYRNMKPAFLLELPKDIIREQNDNSNRLKELNIKVLRFLKEVDDTLCSVENPITYPFKNRLLLENIRLLSQLLIERYVSVKEKESNLLVTYFKDLVNRIKVLRPNEQIEERKKKDIQFIEILRALQRLLGHNDVYFRYLAKFGIRQKPINGDSSILSRQEGVKKLRKDHEVFQSEQDLIKQRYQIQDADMQMFDEYFGGIERATNKLSLIKQVVRSSNRGNSATENVRERTASTAKRLMERQGSEDDLQTKPLDDGYETTIKLELCRFLQHYLKAHNSENINSAFEALDYLYKENQKFFKKKVTFRLDEFLPDPAFQKSLGTQFGKMLLEQLYITSDPQLIDGLLSVMCKMQNACEDFERTAGETLVLTQRSHCAFLQTVRPAMEYLKEMAQCCETWLRVDLESNQHYLREMENCETVLRAILTNLVRVENTDELIVYQRILKQVDLFVVLFDLLSYLEDIADAVDLFQSDEEDAKHATRIYRLCADLLRMMVQSNYIHQLIVYDLLYKRLFHAYMTHPRHFLMRLLQELLRDNSTLLLQAANEQLLYLLDNFIDNAGLINQYLSASDEVVRDAAVLKISELILADERYFRAIDVQLDKVEKQLLTADKYGLKHRTTDTILFGKAVYLRLLLEMVKFIMKQHLLIKPPDLAAFKLQLLLRLSKNFDAIVKVNKSPPTTKFTELKRLNIELCWQLFKLDPNLLLDQQNFVSIEVYFISELNYSQVEQVLSEEQTNYLLVLLKLCFPLMLILLNQLKMGDQSIVFSNDFMQAIIRTIDREPLYREMAEGLRKHYPVPVNFELYVKCMKNVVQATSFPHEFVSQLLRIIEFEIIRPTELMEPQQPMMDNPQIRLGKMQKTKHEIWQKALSKLSGSETMVQAKLAERDFVVNCIINLPKYYVHDQEHQLEAEDYEYVIVNSLDVFRKIVGLAMNVEYIKLSEQSVVLLFSLLCRVLHVTNNLSRFKQYKDEAKVFQRLYAMINHRELVGTCIALLKKEDFQHYRVRASLLKTIRLVLELHKNAHTIWQPYWNITVACLVNIECELTQKQFPYLRLRSRDSPEPALGILLDIIIDLYGKNVYLPLDKRIFGKSRKNVPFFALSDLFMFTELDTYTYSMHRKILDVLSHYTFTLSDVRTVIEKCRLISNKDIFFKKLKLAKIAPEDREFLFRPYTTFLTQGMQFSNGTVIDRRMAYEPTKKSATTGCLRFH